ncbi:MAG: hypothetical protein J0H56_11190 [Micrococcales bacterium]|nr:hypothetical protein [Micrococcales bacterium]
MPHSPGDVRKLASSPSGSTVNFGSLLLFPGGLLLFGGLLLSLTGVRRRGDRGALASE